MFFPCLLLFNYLQPHYYDTIIKGYGIYAPIHVPVPAVALGRLLIWVYRRLKVYCACVYHVGANIMMFKCDLSKYCECQWVAKLNSQSLTGASVRCSSDCVYPYSYNGQWLTRQ